jgi:hypothetical protein
MRTSARYGLLLALACTFAFAQDRPPAGPVLLTPNLRKGQITSPVPCAAKPEQSYALFLPSNYDPARQWPIVYVFDPGARGRLPLELMQVAAERYGYILVGSNNSRNGASAIQNEAATEMWRDTHRRLSIDDRRVYFAGLSGGARVSAQLAQACNCAQGVFLNGAGFGGALPTSSLSFAVFAIPGMSDFNYGELIELDERLGKTGARHFVRRFEGDHAWAPAEVWEDAFAWAAVLEMKDSKRTRDNAVLQGALARFSANARKQEDAGELSFALGEYRATVSAFEGLAEPYALASLRERVSVLEVNPAVRARVKQERSSVETQRRLEQQVNIDVRALSESPDRAPVSIEDLSRRIRGWRDTLTRKRPEERRILERTLGGIYVGSSEVGNSLLDAGRHSQAEPYFQLMSEVRPNAYTPYVALARCHALLRRKKDLLQDLNRAVENGLNSEALESLVANNPKILELAGQEEYARVLASAKATGTK